MTGGRVDHREPLRVLVVDDQALMRSGFSLVLGAAPDLTVVGEAADGAQAVAAARELRPDVIVMDVQMPVMDGVEATREIVAADLGAVLILTTFDRDDYLFDALRAGAGGFLLKTAGPEELTEAVRAVGHGHALLAPEVTMRVIAQLHETGDAASGSDPGSGAVHDHGPGSAPDAAAPSAPPRAADLALLTGRETEVLRLVARGMSNAEIAAELFVGEATVKTHVSSCLSKLHLRDRVQAVVFAYESGLATP